MFQRKQGAWIVIFRRLRFLLSMMRSICRKNKKKLEEEEGKEAVAKAGLEEVKRT